MPSKAVAHISHPENAHLEPPLDMVPWDLGKTLYVPPRLIVGRLDVLVRATRQLSQELRETCFASTHGGRKCEMQRHVDAGLRKMAPSAWDINMHELMMERQERGDTCPVHYAPDADVRGALVIATVSLIDSVAPSRAVYTSLPPAQALRRLDDKMRAGSRVDDPESVSMSSRASTKEGASKPDIAFVVPISTGIQSLVGARIRAVMELKMLAKHLGGDLAVVDAASAKSLEEQRERVWPEAAPYGINEVICQTIFGLRVSHLLSGNALGMALFNTSYTRSYHLADGKIAKEVNAEEVRQGVVSLQEFIDMRVGMAHNLFEDIGANAISSKAVSRFVMTIATTLYWSLADGTSGLGREHDDRTLDPEPEDEGSAGADDSPIAGQGEASTVAGRVCRASSKTTGAVSSPLAEAVSLPVTVDNGALAEDESADGTAFLDAFMREYAILTDDQVSQASDSEDEDTVDVDWAWWEDPETVKRLSIQCQLVTPEEMDRLVALGPNGRRPDPFHNTRTVVPAPQASSSTAQGSFSVDGARSELFGVGKRSDDVYRPVTHEAMDMLVAFGPSGQRPESTRSTPSPTSEHTSIL